MEVLKVGFQPIRTFLVRDKNVGINVSAYYVDHTPAKSNTKVRFVGFET